MSVSGDLRGAGGLSKVNGRVPKDIVALDWKTGRDITLAPALWRHYYFPH